MATRTYEIKGKYTDGTDYIAGTFTVSDGTNGTNGTNGKDALVYPNVIQTNAPTVGVMKVLVSTDFNRTPVINDEFIGVCQYETNKSFIAVWRVQLVSGGNVTCNIVNYVITTGATGQKGADGTNGTNGSNGLDALTTIFIPTLTTGDTGEIVTFETDSFNRYPEIGDRFYCPVNLPNNRSGIATFGVTEVDSTNTTTALLLYTETTGKTGAAGQQGKGIASVQVVEV